MSPEVVVRQVHPERARPSTSSGRASRMAHRERDFHMRQRLVSVAFFAAVAGVPLSARQPPDRSHPPQLGPAPTLRLPAMQKQKLANGLPVWLVELHEVPVVQVNLLVFGGSANETGKR